MPTTVQSNANTAPATPVAAKEQIATCEKVSRFKTSKGEKDVGTFRLNDGQPVFDVWETAYFKPQSGKRYRPVISVVPSAYTNKDGQARANMKPYVNWEEVGG